MTQYSVPLSDKQASPYYEVSPPYRLSLHPHHITDSVNGKKLVNEILSLSFSEHAEKHAMGKRHLLPDGTWSPFKFLNYKEVHDQMNNFASYLSSHLNVQYKDTVGIYSPSRPEWIISALGCSLLGVIFVPLYDTLGPNTVEYVVRQTEMRITVCCKESVSNLVKASKSLELLRYIICIDPITEEIRSQVPPSIQLIEFTTCIDPANSQQPTSLFTVAPSDTFSIMYTSGTTGQPKGVVLSHSNVCSAIGGCLELVDFKKSDVHLSYLPLAHIFELICIVTALYVGMTIGFWRCQIPLLVDDISTLRPTILIAVPRILNRISEKIQSTIASSNRIKQAIFRYAYASKKAALESKQSTAVWDALVFGRIHKALGGRLRLIITGSAPVSAQVQQFMRVVFGVPVRQGYGVTESSALISVQLASDVDTYGHVGAPFGSIEIKLIDVPEFNYSFRDDPMSGEICIRGPSVFTHYYKDEVSTAESLDKDGWFHTGDIGFWRPNGTLQIIDRKKHIFKLSQGEYIAAEMIENIFLSSNYIIQIFVHGESIMNYLVAVVVLNPDAVKIWATQRNLKQTLEQLCDNEELKMCIYLQFCNIASKEKLFGLHVPRQLHLEHEPWTVGNELLTPSMKTKRYSIKSKYESTLEELYKMPRLDQAKRSDLKM